MASKVNTKFVLILILSLGAASAVIGGLYVLNMRGDAERNARLGDEAAAKGDLKVARDRYGRAAHKEPGNMRYLAKLEQVTLKMQPKTTDEARELYFSWVSILQQAARHS